MTPGISTLGSYDSWKNNVLSCSFYTVPCTWICSNVQLLETWWRQWITSHSFTAIIHIGGYCFLLTYSKKVKNRTQLSIYICCLPVLTGCQTSFLYSLTWNTNIHSKVSSLPSVQIPDYFTPGVRSPLDNCAEVSMWILSKIQNLRCYQVYTTSSFVDWTKSASAFQLPQKHLLVLGSEIPFFRTGNAGSYG